MKLAIISEKTRYHFFKPLDYFKNIEIHHLYKTSFSDSPMAGNNLVLYRNIFQLYSNLKRIKPDLIQGLEPYYGYSRFKIPLKILPILLTTMLFAKLHHTPYFFHTLENLPPERKYGKTPGKIMKFIAKKYAQGASFVFYVNNGAKNNLKALGLDEGKMSFALWGVWGVDIKEFQPADKLQKRVIFIGALTEQKGILDLVKAIGICQKKIEDIKLLIIGTGPQYGKVEETISKLGLSKNITLIGEISSAKIATYLAESYLLVSPSKELSHWAEQVGMVLIEAAACGVPVVSTDTGSIAEFVLNDKTGLLVKPSDAVGISSAIIKIWQNEKLHQILAKNARENVLKKYNSQKNTLLLEELIIKKMQSL